MSVNIDWSLKIQKFRKVLQIHTIAPVDLFMKVKFHSSLINIFYITGVNYFDCSRRHLVQLFRPLTKRAK